MTISVLVRPEAIADLAAIDSVEAAAFGRESEAALVRALRGLNQDFISLVAIVDEEIAGHICFSRVSLDGRTKDAKLVALAPLAVAPARQRQAIGSTLVRAGLDACRRQAVDAVFVVGDPRYYARFGFRPAAEIGIRCEFAVPDDVFRVIGFGLQRLPEGVLRYPEPFHQL